MDLHSTGRFAMLRGSLLELPPGPLQVASGGGTLWVTFDGDPPDLVLEPGDRLRVPAGERALAYAMGDAVLEVQALRPVPARAVAPLWRRWWPAPAGSLAVAG